MYRTSTAEICIETLNLLRPSHPDGDDGKMGDIIFYNFKLHCKSIVIKTVWPWNQSDPHTNEIKLMPVGQALHIEAIKDKRAKSIEKEEKHLLHIVWVEND